MAAQTITKKRKSIGDAPAAKKVKTAKSAEKPAPLKSALKKAKEETMVETVVKPTKSKSAKSTKKTGIEPAVETETVVETAVKPAKAKTTESTKKTEKVERTQTKPAAEEEDSTTAAEVADTSADLTADQTAALLAGFSSSDEDEDDNSEDTGIALSKLPKAPVPSTKASDPENTPGVIYLGHLPHGFYEPQMRAYFSQFGTLLHIRLFRNKKTGKSQHYAFIEFASAAVAEIVAKTMDKYILFGRILQVRTVPREQVNENLWKGSERKRRKPAPRNKLEGGSLRRGMEREGWEKRVERETKRREAKQEKLRQLGYEFEMPDLKAVSEVPVKPKEIEQAVEESGAIDVVPNAAADALEVETEVVRTVQVAPDSVTITEEKTTKKRSAGEAKTKKSKKLKT